MNKINSNFLRLLHIRDAIEKIIEYIDDNLKIDFDENNMLQDAVARELEIIGEAYKNISQEFKNTHKHIPWEKMAGLRNRIVHEYFQLDYDVVWQIAKEDIPNLKIEIINILENSDDEDIKKFI